MGRWQLVYDVVKSLGQSWTVDASGEQDAGYWCALVSGPDAMRLFFKSPKSEKEQGWLHVTGRFSNLDEALDASISITLRESLGAETIANEIIARLLPVYEGFVTVVSKVKPFAVEQWLKGLDLAPRTRGHLHNLMRVLWNCAMRWELTEIGENPMKLVRVRGTSKRQNEPMVLGVAQFQLLVKELDEPFRTMVILDLATGLRCSELFALKWCDVLWDDLTLLVRRGIVTGVVSDVKTKYSNAGMPLDPALAEVLLNWQHRTLFKNPEDWVFASPFKAGRTPWYPWGVERRHIIPAGIRCGIGRIGWHTFRHTFRTLLDETGAPMKVQQELMRHADIRTTMNVYGKAMDESKREAHGKVVRLVLPSKVA